MKTLPDHQADTHKSSHSIKYSPGKFPSILRTGLSLCLNLLKHLDSRTRLGMSIMVGMSAFLVLPSTIHLDIHLLCGWIAGVLCFLFLVVLMANSATSQKTRYQAQHREAQHVSTFLLVVITACTSILAIAFLQANNKDLPTATLVLKLGLSLSAVVCSWFLTHTVFALHYATCYYRSDPTHSETGCAGGLDFPGDEEPDYWDFMYFSFTIGMTAQTSDVAIPSTPLRQLAIGHGVVSFLFYMVILASSVNAASGLI